MQLAHIGIFTKDLERLRAFYETYFGLTAGEKYCSRTTEGFESYFLPLGGGNSLELMTRRVLVDPPEGVPTGIVHFAVSLGSREAVTALTETLRAAGCTVVSDPCVTGDGYFESKVLDPDGNQIELTV